MHLLMSQMKFWVHAPGHYMFPGQSSNLAVNTFFFFWVVVNNKYLGFPVFSLFFFLHMSVPQYTPYVLLPWFPYDLPQNYNL